MPPLFSLLGPVLDAGGDLGLIFRMSSLSTCSMTVQPSILVPSVISVRDHTRMQQLAGSTSVIKGRIPKAHTTRQFGKLIRKRPGLPASGAETSAWDIPCSKYVKIIALACSLFLPYFLLVQWAPQTRLGTNGRRGESITSPSVSIQKSLEPGGWTCLRKKRFSSHLCSSSSL